MIRSRRSALIRSFTVLLLVWIGVDLGAHGLLASDFPTGARSEASVRMSVDEAGTSAGGAGADHCFCHSLSVVAILTPYAGDMAPVGMLECELSTQIPPGDPHPLDRPPQLLA